MTTRAQVLAARRRALQARCASQREQLFYRRVEIEARLATVDKGIFLLRSVARHPALVFGAIAGIIAIGPIKALRWLSRGLFWFGLARRAGGFIKNRELSVPVRRRDGD